VPLFGHTPGHSRVAIDSAEGWLLHVGDAYSDPREVRGPKRKCALKIGLFQAVVTTDRKMRFHDQARLRRLSASRPEISVFCAHNPFEFPRSDRLKPSSPALAS
jgi:glyoxylase-like metal-dependent hydrolase (beta-lactamase superfamily II)